MSDKTQNMRTRRIASLTALMIPFLLIGAVTFVAFDKPAEKQIRTSIPSINTSTIENQYRARQATTTSTTTTSTLPPPTTRAKPKIPAPAPQAPSGDILDALARCESGDPAYDGPSGFDGAFQFLPSTWRSMGTAYDFAWQAPYEIQKDAARRLIERSGWGQFPSCARQLGML